MQRAALFGGGGGDAQMAAGDLGELLVPYMPTIRVPKSGDRVYKTECAFSYDSPVSAARSRRSPFPSPTPPPPRPAAELPPAGSLRPAGPSPAPLPLARPRPPALPLLRLRGPPLVPSPAAATCPGSPSAPSRSPVAAGCVRAAAAPGAVVFLTARWWRGTAGGLLARAFWLANADRFARPLSPSSRLRSEKASKVQGQPGNPQGNPPEKVLPWFLAQGLLQAHHRALRARCVSPQAPTAAVGSACGAWQAFTFCHGSAGLQLIHHLHRSHPFSGRFGAKVVFFPFVETTGSLHK